MIIAFIGGMELFAILLSVLVFAAIVVAAVRGASRAVCSTDDTRRAGSGLSWLAAVSACLLLLGGWFASVRAGRDSRHPLPVDIATVEIGGSQHPGAMGRPPADPTGHVPIDELWERLSAPRIPVSATNPSRLAKPDAAASTDDPFGTVPRAGADRDDDSTSDDSSHGAAAPTETRLVVAPPMTGSKADTISPLRPDWVAQPPRMVGGVQRVVLQAGPYTSLEECYRQLRAEMREAVADHLGELVREATSDGSPYVPDLASMGITDGYIIRELLTDQFVEDGEASFGLTKTAWGLVEFTDSENHRLLDAWKRFARRDRIATTATMAGLVLATVGGALALLKIDTWTRGYYTKRLFLGAGAAIIALLIVFAARF